MLEDPSQNEYPLVGTLAENMARLAKEVAGAFDSYAQQISKGEDWASLAEKYVEQYKGVVFSDCQSAYDAMCTEIQASQRNPASGGLRSSDMPRATSIRPRG